MFIIKINETQFAEEFFKNEKKFSVYIKKTHSCCFKNIISVFLLRIEKYLYKNK